MPRTGCPRPLVAVIGLCAFVFSFGVTPALATHYRYATVSWVKDLSHPVPGEYKVTVTLNVGGRWSFPYAAATGQATSPNACPGVTGTGIPQTSPPFVPTNTMGSGSCPPVNRLIQWAGAVQFTNMANALISVKLNGVPATQIIHNARVNTVITTQDLMYTSFTFDLIITAAQNPVKLVWTSNARISQLLEGNADRAWRIESIINAAPPNTKSPQVTSLPLLFVDQNVQNEILLPSVAFDNLETRWRFSTAAESGLLDTIPGSGAGQMTLDPAVPGRLLFTPTAIGPYAAQFMVGSYDPSDPPNAAPKNQIPIDLIFVSSNATPGGLTASLDTFPVTNDLVKVAQVGQPFSFQVQSNLSTPNSSYVVSINNTPLPASPAFGQAGAASFVSPPCNGGGPCTGTFSWTPNLQSTGSVVCFQSVSTSGSTNVTSNSLCVTINLGALPTSLTADPAEGFGGGPTTFRATLRRAIVGPPANTDPLPGRAIRFTLQSDPLTPLCTPDPITDVNGVATCVWQSTRIFPPPGSPYVATFNAIANELLQSSSATNVVVTKVATTSLDAPMVPSNPFNTIGHPLVVTAVLNRHFTDGGLFAPPGQIVTFTLTRPDATQVVADGVTVASPPGTAVVTFPPEAANTVVGNYTVSAYFAGSDLLFGDVTSPPTTFKVYQRTQLSLDPVAPVQSAPITVKAHLQAVPQNTPLAGKSVKFEFTGNSPIPPQTVPTDANGDAHVTVTFQNVTPATIKASYIPSGVDVNRNGLAAVEEATFTTPIVAATQITIAPVTALVGQQKGLSATLRTIAGAPIVGGILTFTAVESAEVLGTSGPTDATGKASVSWTPQAAFNGTYRVDFAGNTTHAPSSATNTLVVSKAVTSLANLAVASSALVGNPLAVSTTLNRPDGIPIPAGLDVVFTLSGPSPSTQTAQTGAGGAVSVSFPLTARGSYTVQASFAETTALSGATSNTAAVTVNENTVVTLAQATGVAGATVRVTATVTTAPGGAAVPAGLTVHFVAGPHSGFAPTDANGVAFFDVVFSSANIFPTSATFAADGNLLASSADSTAVIAPATTNLSVPTVNSVDFVGESLAVSTTLTRTSEPSGALVGHAVTFSLAGPGGSSVSQTVITQAGGVAAVNFPLTVRGQYTVTASFAGDGGHAPTDRSANVTVYQKTYLVANAANGVAAAETNVSAGLFAIPGDAPIAGQAVSFSFTGNPSPVTSSAATNAGGVATTQVSFPLAGAFEATATFSNLPAFFADMNGNPIATTATAAVLISKAITSLDPLTVNTTQFVGDSLPVVTVLTRVSTPSGAVSNSPVTFTLTGPATSTVLPGTTDANGHVQVAFNLTTRGAFTVTASFAGTDALLSSDTSATFTVYQKTQLTLTQPIVGIATKPFDVTATLRTVPANLPVVGQTVSFSFDGGPAQSVVTDGAGVATVNVTYPVKGTHSVTASFLNVADNFADRNGGFAAETDTASIEVKNTPPTFTAPANMTAEATSASGATVTFTLYGDDAEEGPQSLLADCTPASGTFPIGTATVNCTVTDNAGATATGSFTVTVEDTTDPSVTVQANPLNVEAAGANGTVLDQAMIAANLVITDLVDPAPDVVCTPALPYQFPQGSTSISCDVTDEHWNTTQVQFAVNVADTTDPVIEDEGNQTVEATGFGGATAMFEVTATDAVDSDVTVVCTVNNTPVTSGQTMFALGPHAVSCTATDDAGNTATDTFVITVEDTTDPSIDAGPDQTVEATGSNGAPAWFAVTAIDTADSSVAVVCTPSSGATFALGANAVSCVATDDSGNTASDGFTVSVVDTTAPALNLPSPAPVHATGPSGASVNYLDLASATDIVDGTTAVVCGPLSGSTFPIGSTIVSCSSTDAHSNTVTGEFTVTVTNAKPVAVANSYTTNANTPLTIAAPGVLAGDSDDDGDAMTAHLVAGPSHGTLTLNANGSFTYTPAASYAGPDSFTYLANDGRENGNTVTVSLTVQSPEQVAAQTTAVVTAVDPGLANDVAKILDKKQGCMEAAKLTDKITKDKKYTAAEKAAMLAAVAALAQSIGCS